MDLSDEVYMEMKDMETKLVRFYPKKHFTRKLTEELQVYIDAQEKKNKLSVKYILTKYAFQ